ncbi:MAG: hypothetical protein QX196_10215 [Methylococcaceae bacterium]
MKNKLIAGFNESKAMRKSVLLMAVLGVFSLPSQSFASVSTYTDQSAFISQGVIAFDSNFKDFGTYYGFPANPFTRGDVTYTSTQNLTVGSSTPYTTTEPLIGNKDWTPITDTIAVAAKYNMFGFNIGSYKASPISITLNTIANNTANSYTYSGLTFADVEAGLLDYKGFIATPGEYFTGFIISADNGTGYFPAITNVAVGNVAPVPVPAAVWLFASGLLGLGSLRKKTQA